MEWAIKHPSHPVSGEGLGFGNKYCIECREGHRPREIAPHPDPPCLADEPPPFSSPSFQFSPSILFHLSLHSDFSKECKRAIHNRNQLLPPLPSALPISPHHPAPFIAARKFCFKKLYRLQRLGHVDLEAGIALDDLHRFGRVDLQGCIRLAFLDDLHRLGHVDLEPGVGITLVDDRNGLVAVTLNGLEGLGRVDLERGVGIGIAFDGLQGLGSVDAERGVGGGDLGGFSEMGYFF